ncbi:PID-CTERM protein-sorting domain-containing protein [Aurantibacillus circumpalustris]
MPIDNGIIFLIVAGVLYGAKKIYDFRKSAQTLS